MDKFAPRLLDMGLSAMIGKGERNESVCDAVIRNKSVYFCAIGGAGALAANCIKSCEVVAFEDLGCESVKKLWIEKFPLMVANDCHGMNIFSIGREQYKQV
jgi:fumarate hydratase subunit beta